MGLSIGMHYWRFGIGGAERVTLELIRRFTAMGHDLVLYTDEAAASDDLSLPAGVGRVVVPASEGERRAFWESEVKSRSLDLVVYGTWLSPHAPVDCDSIHGSGAGLVYTVHGAAAYFMDKENGLRLLDTVEHCASIADVVVCLNEADVPFWSRYCGEVRVIANPVADHLGPTPSRPRVRRGARVVWVGRLDPTEKRPDLAVRAFARLKSRLPSAYLSMVGGGDERVALDLRRLSERMGVAGAIDFVGPVGDVMPYLDHADAFLMTSPTEGFPLALCEAMHEGLPAAMFDMPHLSLAAGCDGILRVPWHGIEGLGDALVRILVSDDYSEMSEAVIARYREVCETDISSRWADVLDLATSERRGRAVRRDPAPLVGSLLLAYRRLAAHEAELTDELARVREQLDKSRRDAEEANSEAQALRNSLSFRAGRLLTAAPRALRDLCCRGGRSS